jgi:nitrate/TMAO reductase-like tetraheme cytochrome c subunit
MAMETAHADLACRACHNGAPIPGREAAVPSASCQASGCHEAGGPEEVYLATVTFPHRGHGQDGAIKTTCASCHTHPEGRAPLEASVDACALCHVGEVTGGRSQECRICHTRPDHARLTSQGVAVSHSQLPWTEIGCVRCHYDVAEAETEVASATCRQCHEDLTALNSAAVGRDLHPLHGGVTCTSCHMKNIHEVRAMSSAVDLVCSDCHRQAHAINLRTEDPPDRQLCAACHDGVHAAQQRLLLGIRPDGGVEPSEKFLAGITCRSCHIPTTVTSDPSDAIRGQATACAGCHAQEYTQVLDWWLDGIRARLAASQAYVEQAARALDSPPDSAARLMRDAQAMVTLVAEAGGQHNLELADRLLREAVTRARQAYGVAGQRAPGIPDLGRVPHSGMCSYCHYSPGEPWNFENMPDEFHRSIMSETQ